ncbi:hypothetical protein MKW92_041952 [Papaver armeniacum]|nr:hypothetical protein MKW92_041952 [Papaver armeniacum]
MQSVSHSHSIELASLSLTQGKIPLAMVDFITTATITTQSQNSQVAALFDLFSFRNALFSKSLEFMVQFFFTRCGQSYHCACTADRTGQALFHTMYGQ